MALPSALWPTYQNILRTAINLVLIFICTQFHSHLKLNVLNKKMYSIMDFEFIHAHDRTLNDFVASYNMPTAIIAIRQYSNCDKVWFIE